MNPALRCYRSIHGRPRGLSRMIQLGRIKAATRFYPDFFWSEAELNAARARAERLHQLLQDGLNT